MAFQGKIGRYLPMPVRQLARRVHHAYHLQRGLLLGRQPRAASPTLPLGVIGLHASVLGIGQGARLFMDACAATGIAADPIDVSRYFSLDQTLPPPLVGTRKPGATVVHLNPVEMRYLIGRLGRRLPLGGYRIGYWAWETTQIPTDWRACAELVDEIWCPSHFTAAAVRNGLGDDTPVHVIPHPVVSTREVRPDKARLGIDPNRVTLLCAIDFKSSLARKNPMAAVAAFARTGLGASGKAQLIVKVHGADPGGPQMSSLRASLAAVPGVMIIEERLQAEDMALLVASADIVLSPHRSEGFGLVLVEAMAAGKAVIATGWSGNVDFMDDSCAALVRFKLVPVEDPDGIYQGGHWAEPDLDHTAELILTLVSDHARRKQLGVAARERVLRTCGVQTWQDLICERLQIVRASPDHLISAT